MYLILEAYNIDDLMYLVNKQLQKDYVCQGGICSTSESKGYSARFYQAMVLKDESND